MSVLSERKFAVLNFPWQSARNEKIAKTVNKQDLVMLETISNKNFEQTWFEVF